LHRKNVKTKIKKLKNLFYFHETFRYQLMKIKNIVFAFASAGRNRKKIVVVLSLYGWIVY